MLGFTLCAVQKRDGRNQAEDGEMDGLESCLREMNMKGVAEGAVTFPEVAPGG